MQVMQFNQLILRSGKCTRQI